MLPLYSWRCLGAGHFLHGRFLPLSSHGHKASAGVAEALSAYAGHIDMRFERTESEETLLRLRCSVLHLENLTERQWTLHSHPIADAPPRDGLPVLSGDSFDLTSLSSE